MRFICLVIRDHSVSGHSTTPSHAHDGANRGNYGAPDGSIPASVEERCELAFKRLEEILKLEGLNPRDSGVSGPPSELTVIVKALFLAPTAVAGPSVGLARIALFQ